MKLRLTDKGIYVIAIINSLFWILFFGVHTTPDTESYICAWKNSLSLGIIDELRTPIYPLFLGLLGWISGEHLYMLAIITQHCLFLVSIFYFRKMLSWHIKSCAVVNWITLIYAIIPATCSWANCILTECFALTGVVFLFYNILKYDKYPSWSCILWATFWLAFLIFLRPAFLFLIPACIIAWLLFFKRNKMLSIIGLTGVILVSIAEFCYFKGFEKTYGIFAPSSVSVVNQSWLAFQDGLMKPKYTDNVELQQYIENINISNSGHYPSEHRYGVTMMIHEYGLTTVSDAIKASQHDQPTKWIKKAFGRFYRASYTSFLEAYAGAAILTDMIGLDIKVLYLFLILFIVILTIKSFRNHKIYCAQTLLLLTILGNLITAIVGAQAEWGRLLIPSLPLILILIGWTLNNVRIVADEE